MLPSEVAKRRTGCPEKLWATSPSQEVFQGQVEWSFQQIGLVEDIPALCRQGGITGSLKVPFNPNYFMVVMSYLGVLFCEQTLLGGPLNIS